LVSLDEVAPDVYRINAVVPNSPVTFSLFLINDDQPTLIETGFGSLFEEFRAQIARVVDPSRLRYLVVPHLEADECGSLNKFLALAPEAQTVCSPIGAVSSMMDYSTRPPLIVDRSSEIDLGRHKLRFLLTPYVHQWDSMLAFETTHQTLFSSDLFIQPGVGKALTDEDVSESMVQIYQSTGILPSKAHLDAALDQIEVVSPKTVACHHGSVIGSAIVTYIKALREMPVTGIVKSNPMAGY
jgi:flavorubredoxin